MSRRHLMGRVLFGLPALILSLAKDRLIEASAAFWDCERPPFGKLGRREASQGLESPRICVPGLLRRYRALR